MSKRTKFSMYEFQHPDAERVIEAGIGTVMNRAGRVGFHGCSGADKLRRLIKLRECDINLLSLYMPHKDADTQARAQRTVKTLQADMDRMRADLPCASELRSS